jgi:6-pyruvoyl tetrahydropterin synthase/QueD family protein
MNSIEVRINFRAGHRLIEPYKGKCNNVHGEGYTAICVFESEGLDKCDMVLDFGTTKKKIKEWIDTNWDHAYIYNDGDELGYYLKKYGMKTYSLGAHNPTAEYMAKYLFAAIYTFLGLKNIKKVGIVESFEDSIAWYEVE